MEEPGYRSVGSRFDAFELCVYPYQLDGAKAGLYNAVLLELGSLEVKAAPQRQIIMCCTSERYPQLSLTAYPRLLQEGDVRLQVNLYKIGGIAVPEGTPEIEGIEYIAYISPSLGIFQGTIVDFSSGEVGTLNYGVQLHLRVGHNGHMRVEAAISSEFLVDAGGRSVEKVFLYAPHSRLLEYEDRLLAAEVGGFISGSEVRWKGQIRVQVPPTLPDPREMILTMIRTGNMDILWRQLNITFETISVTYN
ncbi:MAG: hypothetical protein PHS44_02305 [Candidatus Dojkabacteria bacterium]|nr:hypothetical protein [Candidatus Dojkabacteria bacterium]